MFVNCLSGILDSLACRSAGTVYTQSTVTNCTLEEVTEAAPDGLRFFQIYFQDERWFSLDVIRRAEQLGYKAIVITVDIMGKPSRWRDTRNGLKFPPHLRLGRVESGGRCPGWGGVGGNMGRWTSHCYATMPLLW